ncbi:MAG: hypothetical protein LBM08_12385 [Dysgonamonadaceae bacterium]|jgi:hypothetical protein|nr:hypothetical protein [Dysgonamonadaceae bacterium]
MIVETGHALSLFIRHDMPADDVQLKFPTYSCYNHIIFVSLHPETVLQNW